MSAIKIILKFSIFPYFRGKIKIKFNLFFKFSIAKEKLSSGYKTPKVI